MKLIIRQFSPTSYYFIPLRSKYYPHTLFSDTFNLPEIHREKRYQANGELEGIWSYLFMFYLAMLLVTQSMNNKLNRMWIEAFVAYMWYYRRICLEGLRKTTKYLRFRSRFEPGTS
jgi:hypothetical protein